MKIASSSRDAGTGRRKALTGVGVIALAAMGLSRLWPFKRKGGIACAPPTARKTIRVLSQDGELMEIEAGDVRGTGKKVSNAELQEWVRRK